MNPPLKTRMRLALLGAALAIAALAPISAAQAQTAVKVAGLRTIAFIPVTYAQKQGYFKREG
ncbi:MAG: hypothetical protein ACRECD_00975, partial [Burkholderiaceae bacterium]